MNLRDDFHFVVAIDFGTTYTGYAYSTRHEFHTNPLNINLMTWNAGSSLSPKAPTCVLFKPDKTFHSFGYQAEDRYNELAMDGEHREWFFFRRFKMHLYQTHIDRNQMLTTEDGKKMPAIKVISSVLSHLKNHSMKIIKDSVMEFRETDIRWVVTVPAIWTDPAKQMMREAAEMVKALEKLIIIK
ncbi:heat shock 70 kDa protein 12B-like [Argopecten irradians]|uniref:heat shock 70 kDa protein 12B-like n=1 Tax=Argopecten irradians TaxID=31199 RepID=UPI0037101AEE